MIVDVHHHYAPPALVEASLAPGSKAARALTGPVTELEARLREMDACGVDMAVLSIPHPGRLGPDGDESAYLRFTRRCNDELLEAAQRRPDRFAVLLTLPYAVPGACVAEFERTADSDLVRGIIAWAGTAAWALDDPQLEPAYQAVARHGKTVLLHPSLEDLGSHPTFDAYGLDASLALIVETSAAAARIMLSGLLDRVPDVTLIIPHLGGVLPYQAQRLADLSGTGTAERDCLHYLRTRCLLDSCCFHPPALTCAVQTVTAERILLGSDYPYRGPSPAQSPTSPTATWTKPHAPSSSAATH